MHAVRAKKTTFEKSLALREQLKAVLEQCPDSRTELAKWIVQDWGGVDKRGSAQYDKIVREAESWPGNRAVEQHKNPAQWSKYLAFRWPTQAAIYDSRVAFSLNWYLKSDKETRLFPRNAGRNTLVDLFDHTLLVLGIKRGFKELQKDLAGDIENRTEHGADRSQLESKLTRDMFHSPDDFYNAYRTILSSVADKLYPECDWRLTKTEMLLFALATVDVPSQVLDTLSALEK